MSIFKYKIIEFTPDQKMEKAFNDLGKDGWELVSVTPISLDVKGEYSSSLCGIGDRKTEGKFEKISAYFNKEVQ